MYKSLIILAVFSLQLFAINFAEAKDSRGRDFIFTFLPNFHQTALEPFDSLSIYVTGTEGTIGNINFRDFAGITYNQPFIIPANGVYLYQLHWRNFEVQGIMQYGVYNPNKQNNMIAYQSFRVTTDNDVSVYALNKTYKSSDATIVFPVNVLGKEYIIASYNSDEPNNPNSNGVNQNKFAPSEFAVVATENNTHIEFELSARAYSHGTIPFARDLNAGDVFLVQTKADSSRTYDDLTGSYIKADKPIAVFSGHQRAVIPNGYRNILVSRDQLYEQMIPIESLGKMYIITPFADPTKKVNAGYNVYRIIAAYDSTEISVNGISMGIFNRGKFYEGKLDNAYLVTASKEVLAAQYMQTTGLAYGDTTLLSYKGDPLMLIVPPKKQYLTDYITYNIQAKEYDQYTYESYDIYDDQFITIISPTDYITTIKMDGKALNPAGFKSIGNTCYSYSSFRAQVGAHHFVGQLPFGVYVYGYGFADSYGYNGGMNFDILSETIPDAKGDCQICPGDTVQLEAEGCLFINWTPVNSLDDAYSKTPRAFPKRTTTYLAHMTDTLGCVYIDSVKVTVVPSPLIDAGRDTSFCLGNFTVLNPSGGVEYRWDKDKTLSCTDCMRPAATPVKSTWYYVTAKDRNGCTGRDSVYITVNQPPIVEAGNDSAFCLGHSLELRPSGGTYYTWDNEKSLSCTECDNPIATPTKKTTYYVTGYNQFGCSARDSITLYVTPSELIEAGRDTSICQSTNIELQALGGISYSWDYNPTLSCLDCANPIASPLKDEMYFVTAVDSNGCIGRDSVRVRINPDFEISVSNDTVVCSGKKAILKVKGAYKYQWEPADKVLCDSCDITESIVDEDITFYVTAESEYGCQKMDSIFVDAVNCGVGIDDLVYPLDVYCYDESSPCLIKNKGELPIILDSIVLAGRDKNNFSLKHNGQYPLVIPKAQDYKFAVEFHPDTKTVYDAYIKAYTNLDRVDTIHIKAEKRLADLKLSATMSGGSKPGDTCRITLNIESDDWSRIHVKYLNLKLQYQYFKFFADEKHFELCGDMPSNWNITAKSDYDIDKQLEIWNINLTGVDELTKNTCLTLVNPVYLLHPTVFYDIEVTGAVPAREICTQVEGTTANINLSYCVDTLRAVIVGKGDFHYDVQNQICNQQINAQAHLPFAANVEISIIDILGQEKNIFKGRLNQGYTKLDHDISNYPPGVYFICFKSGQVLITKKIIINTN